MAKKDARIGRPTTAMMHAVNLALAGKQQQAMALLNDNPHAQHTKANLAQFVAAREEKGPYELDKPRAPRGPRKPGTARSTASTDDLKIDGRTKTGTLVRLEARIQELLEEKDKTEVNKIRKAMVEVDKLREQLEEAEALLA